jgi:hypothetical protein
MRKKFFYVKVWHPGPLGSFVLRLLEAGTAVAYFLGVPRPIITAILKKIGWW